MADWVTISSLATAGGTLVLAVATFSSVRSANRSARVAEQRGDVAKQDSRLRIVRNGADGGLQIMFKTHRFLFQLSFRGNAMH